MYQMMEFKLVCDDNILSQPLSQADGLIIAIAMPSSFTEIIHSTVFDLNRPHLCGTFFYVNVFPSSICIND